MRLPVRVALAMLVSALTLTPAANASAQRQSAPGATLLDTIVPMSATGTVDLTNVGGRITVTGWNRNEVRVLVTGSSARRNEIHFSATSARVSVTVENEHGAAHGDTRYEVSVPAGARLRMHSLTGELIGQDVRGEIEAGSMSGTIRLTGVQRATVSSMSGSVRITGAPAGVRASVVTGNLILEEVGGDIEASSTSGNVTIRGARARSVKAGSMSGNVLYDGTLDRAGRYEFQSHSGNVTLVLPPEADALLAAETFSGNIKSDFTVVLQPGTVSTQRRFELSIGRGASAGPRITATSFSGNITVRRATSGSSGSATESRRSAAAGNDASPQMENMR